MTTSEYRQAVFEAMLRKTDEVGNPIIDEKEARDLLDTFRDDELEFGMPFNTPDEMADILLDIDEV